MPRSTVGTRTHRTLALDATHLVPTTFDQMHRPRRMDPAGHAYLDLLCRCLSGALDGQNPTPRPAGLFRRWRRGRPVVRHAPAELELLHQWRDTIVTVVRERIAGDIVETGVGRGDSIALALAALSHLRAGDRRLWACDRLDGSRAVTTDALCATIGRLGVPTDVPLTCVDDDPSTGLRSAPIDRIALLRVDARSPEASRALLEAARERLASGARVIVECSPTPMSCDAVVRACSVIPGFHGEPIRRAGGRLIWKI